MMPSVQTRFITSRLHRWAWVLVASVLAMPGLAAPATTALAIQDYHHTTWTRKDGAPVDVYSMAQTTDGWLWLASASGLYRFDGVRFERYRLPGDSNHLRRRAEVLRALDNGDLLMTFYLGGGLSVLHPDGRLEDLAEPGKDLIPFFGLTFDEAGEIWVAGASGVQRCSGGKWQTLGVEQGLPSGKMEDIKLDRYGQLWALSLHAVFLYDRTSGKFTKTADLPMASSLIESPDGRMWVSNFQGQRALPPPDKALISQQPARMTGTYSDWTGLFDRQGNLWTVRCPVGLCLTNNAMQRPGNRLGPADVNSRLDQPRQMSALAPTTLLEDREGNIWVATQAGLERFRAPRLTPVHIPDGHGRASLTLDGEGQVWAVYALNRTAWRLSSSGPPVAEPEQRYWVSANDRHGALLLATDNDIERRYKGTIEKIPLPRLTGPDGKLQPIEVWGVQDDGQVLWMMSPQTGLMGLVDGHWVPRRQFKQMPGFVLGTPDLPGRSWLAIADGTITAYTPQRQVSYDASAIGLATSIHTGEQVIAAGDQGMAVFKEGAFHKLSAADPAVLQNVTGLAITRNGDRWLNGGKGLLHVTKADWLASMSQPSRPLRYQIFSTQDGYLGEAMLESRLHSALVDKDDQLWLQGSEGVMRLDTHAIRRNTVAPVVTLLGLVAANGERYSARGKLQLPAGTHSFDILFTAPSLSNPEAVRFQYRLEGEDVEWQEAGPQRLARYAKLTPGVYRFQVRAANEDNIWSAKAAGFDLEVLPTLTQTWWFKLACGLVILAVLYGLYLFRLRQVTARIEERSEVRLAERERIARALHDTILQSVQGVVLCLDAAIDALPSEGKARERLTSVLQNARDAVNQGRAQVHELRTAEVDDVAHRIRDLAGLMTSSYPGTAFELDVKDGVAKLLPAVANEVAEIACEAIRNAFQHAEASKVAVTVNYATEGFLLQVHDNGKGMSGEAKDGHWGLVGMRERAARIGATLEIVSAPGQGSCVRLNLPARRAYPARWRLW